MMAFLGRGLFFNCCESEADFGLAVETLPAGALFIPAEDDKDVALEVSHTTGGSCSSSSKPLSQIGGQSTGDNSNNNNSSHIHKSSNNSNNNSSTTVPKVSEGQEEEDCEFDELAEWDIDVSDMIGDRIRSKYREFTASTTLSPKTPPPRKLKEASGPTSTTSTDIGNTRNLTGSAGGITNTTSTIVSLFDEEVELMRREASSDSRLDVRYNPYQGLRQMKVQHTFSKWTEEYDEGKQLGEGGFGTVFEVTRRADKKMFAMKVMRLDRMNSSDSVRRFEKELEISCLLQHPNIISIHEIIRGENEVSLVMDLCGGDLRASVHATIQDVMGRQYGGFNSSKVFSFASQMFSGLAYLHHYGFAHRDVKLSNYMLSRREEFIPQIKLIDFGLAAKFSKDYKMWSQVGTLHYIAPEVLIGDGYDERCDIWSVGICTYVMATADYPYDDDDNAVLAKQIRDEDYNFDGDNWRRHPEALRDLVRSALNKNAAERSSAKQLLEHPFLRRHLKNAECCTIA